jgi:hypothetical protein
MSKKCYYYPNRKRGIYPVIPDPIFIESYQYIPKWITTKLNITQLKSLKYSNKYILENMEKMLRQNYQVNVSAKKIYRNGKCARDKINQKKKLAEK